MAEHRVHRILGDAVPLRPQVEMQAVHTHTPGRIAQALAHEPAQRLDLRHPVALDHIAKEHAVHIALQQFDARGEREPLRLRESSLDQKLAEALLDERSLDRRRPNSARRWLFSAVTQELAEAEGADDRRHAAPAQRGVHLTREHARR